MNTTTQTPASNDLRYTINTFDADGNTMIIKIRLNDECKNGHQDFAITADVWEKGKPKIDRYLIMGGCCHEEILKAYPDLKIFVDLHLCDYKGIPMHAVANGYYHLREGFNSTKPDSRGFKSKFCEYYRVTPTQFDTLNTSQNEIQFALRLQNLGILEQWEKQANEAIAKLEEWTEFKFLIDSKRTQFNAPTPEQIKEEEEKQANGYYSKEQQLQRANEVALKLKEELDNEEKKELDEIKLEYAIKKQVLKIGGVEALRNCIFYTHTKQIAFNWKGYDKISDDLINKLKSELQLPEGVTFEDKKK
jgi:hypothetical protein